MVICLSFDQIRLVAFLVRSLFLKIFLWFWGTAIVTACRFCFGLHSWTTKRTGTLVLNPHRHGPLRRANSHRKS